MWYPVQAFITLRWVDVLDIFLVAAILYQVYNIVKGTVAIRIFLGIAAIYLFWKLVEAAQMEMSSDIIGQFIGVGVIALIIVFQQELRRFLLLIGGTTGSFAEGDVSRWFWWKKRGEKEVLLDIRSVARACEQMAKTRTGALLVITRNTGLDNFAQTGVELNATVSNDLLQSIFFKNSPLHDGATILRRNEVHAARCVLPVSENRDIPSHLGMRHRAAVGLTEQTDALTIVVSEQTGNIVLVKDGTLTTIKDTIQLQRELRANLSPAPGSGI